MLLYAISRTSIDLFDSVTNITEEATTLTSSLAAKAVPLSDVASSYNLEFGHAMPIQQAHRLTRSLKTIEGDFDKTESAKHIINAGQPNERINIFTDSK